MFVMKICRLGCLALLLSKGLSAPVLSLSEAVHHAANDIHIRDTPPLPEVDEIKKHLDVAKDTSLFYSGPGSYAKKARDWAKNKKNGYKVLPQFWKDSKYPDPWQNDPDTSSDFFNRASQALAELSSGIVYTMLPSDTKGKDWKAGTVWDKYEWPNLGPDVTKVIRVNPDNDDEETIKGDGASATSTLPLPATCYPTTTPESAPRDYVHDTISKYCKYMATGTNDANDALDSDANQGVTTAGAITINQTQPYGPVGYAAGPDGSPESANTLWLSISLSDDAACKAGFKVNEATCENMLGISLDGCDTGSTDKKYGGSTNYECGVYDIQLKAGHDNTPPKGFGAEGGG